MTDCRDVEFYENGVRLGTPREMIERIRTLQAELDRGPRLEMARAFWADVCAKAEVKMLLTGKLEGAHYAAATELLAAFDLRWNDPERSTSAGDPRRDPR